jgi:hypothetical protein
MSCKIVKISPLIILIIKYAEAKEATVFFKLYFKWKMLWISWNNFELLKYFSLDFGRFIILFRSSFVPPLVFKYWLSMIVFICHCIRVCLDLKIKKTPKNEKEMKQKSEVLIGKKYFFKMRKWSIADVRINIVHKCSC